MAVTGVPQWATVRGLIPLGSSTVGSTNEVDACAYNGTQYSIVNSSQAAAYASHTVSGGPTTTSPWQMEVNGVAFFGPFNIACSLPDFLFQAFVLASQAGWIIT